MQYHYFSYNIYANKNKLTLIYLYKVKTTIPPRNRGGIVLVQGFISSQLR